MNQIKQMEHMTEALGRRPPLTNTAAVEKADSFPVKCAAGAFVPFTGANPSFAALNRPADGARLSINSSNRSSDTSITAAVYFRPLCIKRPQMSDRAPDLAVAVITPDISP